MIYCLKHFTVTMSSGRRKSLSEDGPDLRSIFIFESVTKYRDKLSQMTDSEWREVDIVV